jgi:hypothetical protein
MTQEQVNKKYKGRYVAFSQSYDYVTGEYDYTITKTSRVIKENMTLGEDVGTALEYRR